ncbi:MAG: 3-isopropylmalate dehydratase large subunit, partial [Alphaproteobacteria bacterium]
MSTSAPRTLFQKIWDAHIVAPVGENGVLLYIDRHLVNEVTSPQAFEGLRERGLAVRRPDLTMAVADHNVPTTGRAAGLSGFVDRASRLQVEALERNVGEFGVPYIPLNDPRQGIVHVVGPELGFTLPGTTIVCGDSHTSTHGAFGALAFGIGTSEVEQVLATQCIVQRRAKSMLVHVEGVLGFGVTAKDLILAIVARIGASGAAGHVVEYAGPGISALDMSERMTVCNMSIEAGARAGMIAPDLKALHWLAGRPLAPKGAAFVAAESAWLALRSDDEAVYDRVVSINASEVAPMVSWGTSPDAAVPITGTVPLLADLENASRPSAVAMMEYMGLTPGSDLAGLSI